MGFNVKLNHCPYVFGCTLGLSDSMPIRLSVGLPISLYVCLLSVTEVMSVSYLVYFLASQSVGQSVALSFYHGKGGNHSR